MTVIGLRQTLEQARIVPEMTAHLGADRVYLVGGALRDLLLGRPIGDFDFALPGNPTDFARGFAGRIGGHWFMLDKQRRQSRVVAGDLTYDFAPFRAADLEKDLRLRDFTINALALPLAAAGFSPPIFDPLGGQADIAERRLRACSPGVFEDDPLRVLKGVRHAAVLSFAVEAETFQLMREAAGLLGRVAPERVRAELAAICAAAPVAPPLRMLEELGLLREIFGPPAPGGAPAAGETVAVRTEALLAALAAEADLADLLAGEFEAGLTRAALLKLAAFLRGYRPAELPARLAGLRLGRRTSAVLSRLYELPAAKAQEAERLPDYERGRALWAAKLGGSPVDALLFLAGLREEAPVAALAQMLPVLRAYRKHNANGRVPDLIDGIWLRENLGIGEGQAAGEALAAVRREEIAGRVRSVKNAKDFLLSRRREND
ncbi:MAG: hypothetical protein WDA20_09890 [Desulfuromonadales bacterium]